MMDIARHGIFRPEFFSFEELMCIFLAVLASDVILLDLFNTLGMPTSTTVSMVFELLGGSTALALIKMFDDSTLTYAGLINTDKAFSVILAIFVSVAIAFVFGTIVQWISRLLFTFHYTKHLRYTIGLFGGVSITSIAYFLLVKGFGSASFMTDAAKERITGHTHLILLSSFIGFSILMQVLHWCKINVFKIIVLFGTFSLAMAFAGNDLVNFIGVTLAGFSSYQDFIATPGDNPATHMMGVLNESARTPVYFLVAAGIVMTVALMTSKKAQNVVKTSVDLSRQTAGDEMFGSSRFARRLVRSVINANEFIVDHMPSWMRKWIDSRFYQDEAILPNGAAFDLVRASVNLVLAGLLIVLGTSLKLPLSTTYVAFMVGMGSSLADRAWGRESAVFRVTGVIPVIGGWFMTAGAAFFLCFIVTLFLHFGGIVAMVLLIVVVVILLINNNRNYKKKMAAAQKDEIFTRLVLTNDKDQAWVLLNKHISVYQSKMVKFIAEAYMQTTDGLITEDVKMLRRTLNELDDERKNWKVIRRKELVGLRKIDQLQAVEKDTWFHLACNSCEQCLYCLKRMCEPTLEHVDNNFNPIPEEYVKEFMPMREGVEKLMMVIADMIETNDYDKALQVRQFGDEMKAQLSQLRKTQQGRIRKGDMDNLKIEYLYMSTLQETQEIIGHLRHWVRACRRFQQEKGIVTIL
ncbi:MAG: inorganic phosphate transporter, partial [Paraprevotella sp.]|nr:inorganic phosphate transporter [Paraprevotella sp.]